MGNTHINTSDNSSCSTVDSIDTVTSAVTPPLDIPKKSHNYRKCCGVYVEDLSFEDRLKLLSIILKE